MGSGPGYGRWTGLRGDEASAVGCRRLPSGSQRAVGVRPRKPRCLPSPVAAAHSKCGPAPRPLSIGQPVGAAARRGGRVRKGVRGVCRVVGALKSPGARSRVAPGLLPPSASEKPAGGGALASGIHPQGSRSAALRVQASRRGVNGPACRGPVSWWRWFSPLATRAESSDRRVSGPSVERARLRGRGGSGSLYRRCWPVR